VAEVKWRTKNILISTQKKTGVSCKVPLHTPFLVPREENKCKCYIIHSCSYERLMLADLPSYLHYEKHFRETRKQATQYISWNPWKHGTRCHNNKTFASDYKTLTSISDTWPTFEWNRWGNACRAQHFWRVRSVIVPRLYISEPFQEKCAFPRSTQHIFSVSLTT
jgi:hypothetical protein